MRCKSSAGASNMGERHPPQPPLIGSPSQRNRKIGFLALRKFNIHILTCGASLACHLNCSPMQRSQRDRPSEEVLAVFSSFSHEPNCG